MSAALASARDDGADLGPWLARWGLRRDGAPTRTAAARLCPVRRDGTALMLKLSLAPEEEAGAALLGWWDGDGAVRVVARQGPAILMERGEGDLAAWAREGRDDEATLVLAGLARRLHAVRPAPPPPLVPLGERFAALGPAAAREGGLFARAAEEAAGLLAAPRGACPLHGDLHHGNALRFGGEWRAIDPKGLWGEPAYDLVPLLLNPDVADPSRPIATLPGRLAHRVRLAAPVLGVEPRRVLRWALAGAGLSAAWSLEDGDRRAAGLALGVARAAAAELDR